MCLFFLLPGSHARKRNIDQKINGIDKFSFFKEQYEQIRNKYNFKIQCKCVMAGCTESTILYTSVGVFCCMEVDFQNCKHPQYCLYSQIDKIAHRLDICNLLPEL